MSAQTFEQAWSESTKGVLVLGDHKNVARVLFQSRDAEVAALQTKLTESQRLNKVALEAMKMALFFEDAASVDGYAEHSVLVNSGVEADWTKVRRAIKEIEGAMK